MDYHLEWLYGALRLAANGGQRGPFPNPACVRTGDAGCGSLVPLVLGNPEDIDLLIAFESDDPTYLLFIEAKGGTSFTNKQMLSKVRRLSAIFRDPAIAHLKIEKRLVIASPREPGGLFTTEWEPWMLRESSPRKPWWIPMDFPSQALATSRCDAQGRSSAQGDRWTVVQLGAAAQVAPAQANGTGAVPGTIGNVSMGQNVTYTSTVTGQVEIGTVQNIDLARNRVLVKRPNGSSGWMLPRTVTPYQPPAA